MKNDPTIKLHKNNKSKTSVLSLSSSKKFESSNEMNKYRSDKVEKKLYLDNISMKNDIISDLLAKLSSTFRTYNYQFNEHDPKIESNLFHIGAKRTIILRKSMNTVRNMIQNFDNQFSINLDLKPNKHRKTSKINSNIFKRYEENNKNDTKQIKEESLSDYDFNLNKLYDSSNSGINNNQMLINCKNFFQDMKKGKKFLKDEKSFENKIKNEKKIIGLKNAFKYYELLYNYKYFLTEKDILCLSFNQRKKMEKVSKEKYLKKPRIKLDQFKKKCEKCHKTRTIDKFKYKNNLNIHLFNKNLSDTNLKCINKKQLFKTELNNEKINNINNNSKRTIKRTFSGNISANNFNKENNFSGAITRANSASTNKILKFNKTQNLNSILSSSKRPDLILNLSISSSSSTSPNPKTKLNSSKKSSKFLSIKRKIKNLSQAILTHGEELKNNLKEAYENIMDKIEEEKRPVKKVKKNIKIDIEKIRAELNLKRRGKGINEYKMIMDNVDKLYKSLPKTHVNLMRSIAKIVIYEDLKKNRPLIYNDTLDNKLFKKRFKKEMNEASYKMKEIRKSLNKNKKEKPFQEKLEHLLKNDGFVFYNIKTLKDEINKIKVLKGEIITD